MKVKNHSLKHRSAGNRRQEILVVHIDRLKIAVKGAWEGAMET